MKKCPFTQFKKECTSECALYQEVVRIFDDGKTGIAKGCIFILDHEERRNQTERIAMLQAEMGVTKNAMIFQAMAIVDPHANIDMAREEIARIAIKNVPQLIEGKKDGDETI